MWVLEESIAIGIATMLAMAQCCFSQMAMLWFPIALIAIELFLDKDACLDLNEYEMKR